MRQLRMTVRWVGAFAGVNLWARCGVRRISSMTTAVRSTVHSSVATYRGLMERDAKFP